MQVAVWYWVMTRWLWTPALNTNVAATLEAEHFVKKKKKKITMSLTQIWKILSQLLLSFTAMKHHYKNKSIPIGKTDHSLPQFLLLNELSFSWSSFIP